LRVLFNIYELSAMMNPLIWPGGMCTPLAKKEILATGPFGIACWLSGITFIDRLNPEKSRDTMHKLAERINKDSVSITETNLF
jgi:hypothetical protein